MPLITTPTPRTRQPQVAVGASPRLPATAGLWNFGAYENNLSAGGGFGLTQHGAFTRDACVGGQGHKYSTAASEYGNAGLAGASRYAWVAAVWRDASSTNTFSVVRHDGSLSLVQEAVGAMRCVAWPGGSLQSQSYASGESYSNYVGVVTVLAGRVDEYGGTAYRFRQRDGLATNSLSAFGGTLASSGGKPWCIGGAEGNVEIATPWTILSAAVWRDNIPSDVQIRDLLASQSSYWKLFAPIPRRIWVPASGGGNVYSVSATESAAAADVLASAAAFAAAAVEPVFADDLRSATAALIAALIESSAAADATSASSTGSYSVSIVEAVASADIAATTALLVAAATEAASASDSSAAAGTLVGSVTESAAASDVTNWGGAVYGVTLTESASATDAISAAAQLVAQVTEAGAASDSLAVVCSFGAQQIEAVAALEVVAAARQTLALLTESVAASDVAASPVGQVYSASVVEAIAAADIVAVTVTPQGSYARAPVLVILPGRPAERTLNLAKPARKIGALLKGP